MTDKLKWAVVVVASMALGAASIVGINALEGDEPAPATTIIERVSQPQAEGVSERVEGIPDLVQQVRPSIVKISTQSNGFGSGGVGSGIVLDKDGHILTNNHVVTGGDFLDVTLLDGSSASARVVGRDVGNDLAVIRADLPADSLVPAQLGDSDGVRIGEFVMAIGNPFDIEGSVTTGVVSGLGRSLVGVGGRAMRELIQADAAINPGNSGGALFNARGEVIGITTAIENPTQDRVFIGVGYAVPVNTATRFLPQMLAGENIQHPRLGISLDNLTPSVAEQMGLDQSQQGVLIVQVVPGSAADQAGLNANDVIVSIDGAAIEDFDDLAEYIDLQQVGDTVDVTVLRNAQELTVPVTLEAWITGSA